MTIGSLSPAENKGGPKNKEIIDENAPLLPTKHEVDGGFDGFNAASFSGAVFNLSTTVVGAGIMALPATMKVLGLAPGIALIIFFAFLTEASIDMLIRFSRAGKTISYAGVMGDAFGKIGKMLLQICVVINNVGVMIVYMIIIGMTSDEDMLNFFLFCPAYIIIIGCLCNLQIHAEMLCIICVLSENSSHIIV